MEPASLVRPLGARLWGNIYSAGWLGPVALDGILDKGRLHQDRERGRRALALEERTSQHKMDALPWLGNHAGQVPCHALTAL